MARARNIKPALFDNDELAENDPLGRLLFIGMWTIADFKGDFVWREKRIKAKLLPYDNCDIKKLAINLDKSGFIRFYSDGDEVYCRVVNFSVHQNPHKNERDKGSDIPAYKESMRQAVDLKGLAINRDKSGLERNDSTSDRADSLIPYPDSLSLNPETFSPESNADKSADNESLESDFDIFYSAGMVKKGRKQSLAKFKLLAKKNGGSFEFANMLANDIKKRIESNQFGFDTLNPATYLNNERWKDEIKQAQSISSNRQTMPDRSALIAKTQSDTDCPFYGQEAIDHQQPNLLEGELV